MLKIINPNPKMQTAKPTEINEAIRHIVKSCFIIMG